MRRVSSRQRLAYASSFEATAILVSSDEEVETSLEGCDENSLVDQDACSETDLALLKKRKRPIEKRTIPSKQEPAGLSIATASSLTTSMPCTTAVLLENGSEGAILATKDDSAKLACSPASMLPVLTDMADDVLLNVMSFLCAADLRRCMQVNRHLRRLMASPAADNHVWKQVCLWQWPCLEQQEECDHVDALGLSIAAVGVPPEASNLTGKTKSSTNHTMLLSLAAKHMPERIDFSFFGLQQPSRHRSRRRFPVVGNNAAASGGVPLRTVQVALANADEDFHRTVTAVQFTGRVGLGNRCVRANQPLPGPAPLAPNQLGQQQQKSETNRRHLHDHLFASGEDTLNGEDAHNGTRRLGLFRRLAAAARREMPRLQLLLENPRQWRPFVIPHVTTVPNNAAKKNNRLEVNLTPRLVAYFEVSILEAPERVLGGETDDGAAVADTVPLLSSSECVAVGLASADFDYATRMPGWDTHSYGYHSDDGGIFHAAGFKVGEYGPKFGSGETVGCGIDYAAGCIFYTLNGVSLGPAFELSQRELSQDWYPTVGMDTKNLIACNFGMRPFQFDLSRLISKQKDTLLQILQPNKNTSEAAAVTLLPTIASPSVAADW